MDPPLTPYWPVGFGSDNPAEAAPELVHSFMLPPLPLDTPAHVEWLRHNIAPARNRFMSRGGEPLLGCWLGKLCWRDGTGRATAVETGAGVYAASPGDGRAVLVAAILLRAVGEWSEARVEIYEPGALPAFDDVFDAIAAGFPACARQVAAVRTTLAEHIAATWRWVSFPSKTPISTEPAAAGSARTAEPAAPPTSPTIEPAASAEPAALPAQPLQPPKDSPFAAWFEWRAAMRRTGHKVTLETIAQEMGYSHAYIKQQHALWRAEHVL